MSKSFSRELGYKNHITIPEVSHCNNFFENIESGGLNEPFVIKGFAKKWPAVKLWDKDYLIAKSGSKKVGSAVDLPGHGVPYLVSRESVRRNMTLKEFCTSYLPKGRCYIDQVPLDQFSELQDDVLIHELLGKMDHRSNFWLGKDTKSGLHFDGRDNIVIMIRGKKTAVLASPSDSRDLYPFYENVTRSQIDVETLDFDRYPRALNAEFWHAELEEGDVLYIPQAWWHFLSSSGDGYTISVNCWFGRRNSLSQTLKYIRSLGLPYMRRTLRDFFVHGVMRRAYFQRSFAGPPDGVLLHYIFKNFLSRVFRLKYN